MNKNNYDSLPEEFIELYTRELDVSLSLGSLWVEGYKLYKNFISLKTHWAFFVNLCPFFAHFHPCCQ